MSVYSIATKFQILQSLEKISGGIPDMSGCFYLHVLENTF